MTTTRGVGQVAGAGTGSPGPAGGLGGVTPAAPGVVGGVAAVTGVSRAVLWVPPVAGAGLNGAPESPLQNLRVGQQVSAQVLVTDATAGRALLLMDGQRVAADVPDGLHEGQVVNLAVASVTTERLVLRLTEGGAPARVPTAPLDAAAVLRALDLPDTPATRAVVTALVERGQPLTRETIVALRAVVARETGQEVQNARGAVDALLRGIPVTLRSSVLARAATTGAAVAPMGSLLQELMAAIDASSPGALRTPVEAGVAAPATGAETAAGAPVEDAPVPPPPGWPSAAVPTADARGALARLLEGMVAREPSATELRRVVSVLQGAPEARIAQAILGATASAAADAGDVGVAAAVPGPAGIAPTSIVAPGGGPVAGGGIPVANGGPSVPGAILAAAKAPAGGGAPGIAAAVAVPVGTGGPGGAATWGANPGAAGTTPATGPTAPDLSTAVARAIAAGVGARATGLATEGDGSRPTPVAVATAGAVPVALAASLPAAGASAWVAAGPDARSFLGAMLAMFGGTARPGAVVPGQVAAPVPVDPNPAPNVAAGRPEMPAAILARVIHDRLEYQQLGNAAALARGGWDATGTAAIPAPGATAGGTAGATARPEAGASAFPANVAVPPPGDALNFSIPLAFAGQLATLELAVWRDGGRRQDAPDESTPGLHARVRLDLEQLGRVGADIRIVGTSLRCRLTADRDETNALLRANGEALLDRLRDAGFSVEGLDYRPFAGAIAPGPVAGASVVRRVDMGA